MNYRSLLWFFVLLFPLWALSQEQPPSGRPKLGLALSGGGAKGFAHIGVLRVLEEAGLRPDMISGTSMGGIIGGLYSIGYSADSLYQIVRSQHWSRVLSDQIDLNEVLFEEKPFFKNEFLELPLQNGKVAPPSGLIEGQQIEQLLSKLALPVFNQEDFSAFPIPFLCVAANVATGEPVVLDSGYLPDALRTTMAIPSVFTVVNRDSQVLVDGGLVRNFPVVELVERGAEVIIGVYTGARSSPQDKLTSFSDILYQSGFLMSIKDAEAQLPYLRIFIEPDLSALGADRFDSYEAIIAAGEREARKFMPVLKHLADSLNALGPLLPLPPIPRKDSVFVDLIEINGNQFIEGAEILGRSGLEPGAWHTAEDLDYAVRHLYGTNLFRKVNYWLKEEYGQTRLVLRCKEKLPAVLKTSILYDSYGDGGFLFSLTARNKLLPASRAMFIGQVAENYHFRLNYLKYLGRNQLYSLFSQVSMAKALIPNVEQGGLVGNEYRLVEIPFDMRLQRRIGNNAQIALGLKRDYISLRPLKGKDAEWVERVRSQSWSASLSAGVNTLNSNVFPTRGIAMHAEFTPALDVETRLELRKQAIQVPPEVDSLGKAGPYQKIFFHILGYLPLHSRASLKWGVDAGLLFNVKNPLSDFFLLGGPEPMGPRTTPFYGMAPNELNTSRLAITSIGYQQTLTKRVLFSLDVSAGFITAPFPVPQQTPQLDTYLMGGGLTLGYRTIAGPVKATISKPLVSSSWVKNDMRFFLSFGYRF
ncbi:MAG: hypothetical protein KIPDCIKN_04003 [Haliscomenobacter sp.]|jgi:NTE family protein|nr:hypothetical protein [Haliscomenobacter sp.]